eukprot:EG_transcript_5759
MASAAAAAPTCPVHHLPLSTELRGLTSPQPYLYCKMAAAGNGQPACPDMPLSEWRRQTSEARPTNPLLAPAKLMPMPKTAPLAKAYVAELKELMSEEMPTAGGGLEVPSVELSRTDSETMSVTSDTLNGLVFELPDSPEGLKEDPRTGLRLISVPAELRRAMGPAFAGDPLLHYVGLGEKMNQKQAFSRRVVAISSYCIYVLHPLGGLARALQVTDIKRLWVSNTAADRNVFAFLSPAEFDLVLRSPEAETIQQIVKTIFRYKKGRDLPVADLSAEMVMSSARVAKPPHWRPEMLYVHSRGQLYRRLQQHNDRDASLEYLHMERDPRTMLELMTLPRPVHHLFRASPFAADREPLLHFLAPCEQLSDKAAKRLCLISNSCIYIYNRSAKLDRCVAISAIDRVATEGKLFAIVVPQEHDLLLEFPELDGPEAAAMVCAAVYRLKRGVTLPVGEAVDAAALRLKAPRGWRSEPRPVLTRRDLVDFLQANRIKPGVPADVQSDGLEPT